MDTMIDNEVDLNVRVSSFASAAIANGSFEFDADGDGIPDGWTRTLYAGGSGAINTGNYVSGDQCYSFTSTVLANGGGDLLQTDFSLVAGGKDYPIEAWAKGSVANISSKIEINWYDNTQSFISASVIANLTNTPTVFTNYGTVVVAPATARFAKIKLTGGVPGAGSATGTIYFDHIVLGEVPILSVSTSMIANGAVRWGKINASLQQNSGAAAVWTSITFTGGGQTLGYGITEQSGDSADVVRPYASTTYTWGIGVGNPTGTPSGNYYFQSYYINSSPPWNMGDGDIPLFAFLEIRPDGTVVRVDIADAPPWGYNGPTSVIPSRETADGRKFRRSRQLIAEYGTLAAARAAGLTRAQVLNRLYTDAMVEEEITQAIKNRDMPLIPHPFGAKQQPGNTIVLLDPVSPLMQRLATVHREQSLDERLSDLLLSGAFNIGNTALNRAAPPGVLVVTGSLR